MTETTQGKQFLTVAKVFFLLIVIPLFLMALLIGKGIVQLGDTAKKRAVTVLDQKSQEEIKLRAMNVADEVADFLNERGKDVLIATILPTTDTAYKEFISKNKQALWIKKEGKVLKALAPLYTEMSLIDKAGNEIIRVGKYGNEDCQGGGGDKKLEGTNIVIDPEIPLARPSGMAVYKDWLFLSDMYAHRVLRCKLTYAAEKEVSVSVRSR